MFCELFFRSSSFPARVRAQVHVRSDLDASAVPPFFFSGPFPPFSGPFGVSVSPCVRTPSSSSQPGPWRMVHSSLSWKFQLPFPFVFLAFRSCPVRRPCFRYPAGPASVPLAPCAAPRLLLPLVFCRQAYGPCLSSSFRLAPFALASPAPTQHGFLHSSWLSSVLALVSLSAP